MKKLFISVLFLFFSAVYGNINAQGYDFDLNDLEGNSVKLSELTKNRSGFLYSSGQPGVYHVKKK